MDTSTDYSIKFYNLLKRFNLSDEEIARFLTPLQLIINIKLNEEIANSLNEEDQKAFAPISDSQVLTLEEKALKLEKIYEERTGKKVVDFIDAFYKKIMDIIEEAFLKAAEVKALNLKDEAAIDKLITDISDSI